MEIRTRHMALFLYAGMATAVMVIRPEIVTDITTLMIVLTPIAGMFAWDKIKGGSIKK